MALDIKTRYAALADSPSAEYPTGKFRNKTNQSTNDGTPFEKDWTNDLLGMRDAILAAGSVEADGNVETATSSQVVAALRNFLAPLSGSSVSPTVLTSADDLNDIEDGWCLWYSSSVPDNAPRTFGVVHQFPAASVPGAKCQEYYNAGSTTNNDSIMYRSSGAISPNPPSWHKWIDMRPIGVGQSWQDLLSSRGAGVNYTNTTGRTIYVIAKASANSSGSTATVSLTVDGVSIPPSSTSHAGVSQVSQGAAIPPDSTYRVNIGSVSVLDAWVELR